MFNVTKSAAPTKPFQFNDDDIADLVKRDFSGKCYLCEEQTPRHLEVEHFYPQAYYPHLVHEWSNLLCICEKCNKIRPRKINTSSEDEVLSCTEDDVENLILIRFNEANNSIEISSSSSLPKVRNTVTLLNRIHSGLGTTSLSYIDLRKLVAEELAELEAEIDLFETTILKAAFQRRILKKLMRASCFSAIKRTYVSEKHPDLTPLFD